MGIIKNYVLQENTKNSDCFEKDNYEELIKLYIRLRFTKRF
jgi:hypothetical protein